MAVQLPPIPNNPVTDTFVWRDWFYKVSQLLVQQASIAWTSIDFTGSNIQDIQNRQHNALQAIQGGIASQYYHLTFSEYTRLQANLHNSLSGLQGGTTNEYYHLTAAEHAAVLAAYVPKSGAFHYDYTTTLSASITNSVTTIPVTSTTGFSSTGALIIENEIITYTGITPTSFTGCSRGVNGSGASSHTSGTPCGGAQVIAGAMTPATVQINTTDFSNGVTLNTSTSEISVSQNGTYNIQYSIQMFNSSNSQDLSNIWYVLNGTNIASSASWVTTAARAGPNTPASAIITVNLFLTLTTTDKVSLKWLTTSGNSTIVTYPGSGTSYPAAPAVIVTVNQIA